MGKRTMFAATAICVLGAWVTLDVAGSGRHDPRQFDGHEVGRLETAMWRSYYEHRPVRLFGELQTTLRDQFHLSFWRSWVGAYYAARSAVVFQKGHSRADYERALPDLERYYALIRGSSTTYFDARRTARLELEWWIVHRQRAQHRPEELYAALAEVQSEIYRMPADQFAVHARMRGDAMLLRDERGQEITDADWRRIGTLLDQSWVSLGAAVRR
jgi:hypothetical protein